MNKQRNSENDPERNIKSMFPEARDIVQLIKELEARDPKFDPQYYTNWG